MTNTENTQRKYHIRITGDPTKENQSMKTEEIIKTIIPVHFPERKDWKLHTERSHCYPKNIDQDSLSKPQILMKKSLGSWDTKSMWLIEKIGLQSIFKISAMYARKCNNSVKILKRRKCESKTI